LDCTRSLPDPRNLGVVGSLVFEPNRAQAGRLRHQVLKWIARASTINDPFGPPEIGERILKIMSQAALKIIEGGHTPWLTESEYIAPILSRFLHQIDKLNG